MAGCNSLLKIHIFGQRMTKTNRQRLGFTNSMPSYPTITQTLKRIDPEEFEAVLSQLVACQLDQNFIQITIDGKSIRSTSDSTKGLLHLVSAFASEVGAVLIQSKSGLGGGEIATAEKLITNLDIKNKVITGDALYAQEVLSNKIVSRSGDYVFKVKRNKKKIIDDIKQGFEHYSNNNLEIDSYEYTVKGHGRIESRKIDAIESHRKYFGGWVFSDNKKCRSMVVFLFIIFNIFSNLIWRIVNYLSIKIFPEVRLRVVSETFSHVSAHSHQYFQDNLTGDLVNKIQNIGKIIEEIFIPIINIANIFFTVLIAIFIANTISIYFSLALTIWVILFVTISIMLSKDIIHYSKDLAQINSILSGKYVDSLMNIFNVSIFARQEFEKSYLESTSYEVMTKDISLR